MGNASLELRLFGRFGVEIGGRMVGSPKAKKAQAMIGYLAIRTGRQVSRAHLAALLWPDSDPGAGRFNLRQLLFSVRKEAPELSTYLQAGDGESLVFDGRDCS